MKYEAVIDIVYPSGRVQTLTHQAPWIWLAALICRIYIYGTLLMPLAGGGMIGMTLIRETAK